MSLAGIDHRKRPYRKSEEHDLEGYLETPHFMRYFDPPLPLPGGEFAFGDDANIPLLGGGGVGKTRANNRSTFL